MSKSYGNAIALAESPEEFRPKVLKMLTDPARKRRNDPGNPDVCPVFSFHKVFSQADEIAEVDRECRVAGIGCVDCKKIMLSNLESRLEPHTERRARWARDPDHVRDVLKEGARRARKVAGQTMQRVRKALHLSA
jgi:tryptophanyl-tRNA synthetase